MDNRVKKQIFLSGWGNYPSIFSDFYEFDNVENLTSHLQENFKGSIYSMGRGYGDCALYKSTTSTKYFNKIMELNLETKEILCEAGVTFDDLLKYIIPKDLFLPVTPGTKFISVGGAVASDIHGKNHHIEGSFCQFVKFLKLMLADGSIVQCSPTENRSLFLATCGGMGLTGVILQVSFLLKPIETSFIQETVIIY